MYFKIIQLIFFQYVKCKFRFPERVTIVRKIMYRTSCIDRFSEKRKLKRFNFKYRLAFTDLSCAAKPAKRVVCENARAPQSVR